MTSYRNVMRLLLAIVANSAATDASATSASKQEMPASK
jgi:hypothetical protein